MINDYELHIDFDKTDEMIPIGWESVCLVISLDNPEINSNDRFDDYELESYQLVCNDTMIEEDSEDKLEEMKQILDNSITMDVCCLLSEDDKVFKQIENYDPY